MALVNTIYFKALWQKAFFKGSTQKASFYPKGKPKGAKQIATVDVDMMSTAG